MSTLPPCPSGPTGRSASSPTGEHPAASSRHGSGTLARTLIENDLVDELRLLVFPVIVGAGRRLFPDAGVATGLRLVDSCSTGSGTAIHSCQPTGRPEFGEVELG